MFDRRTMPLSALRAFESAALHLNLVRAGESLGVTHGAISHQVRALEVQLGIQLFVRSRKGLRLTKAGERLFRSVRSAFDEIVEGSLHLDPDSLSGTLTIGFTPTIGSTWGLRLVCDFFLDYPETKIDLIEVNPVQRTVPPALDIGVYYGRPTAPDRRVELLMSGVLFPVGSARFLSGKSRRTFKPEDLLELPLLQDPNNTWDNWFAFMNVELTSSPRYLRMFSTHFCLDAARKGYGIALANPMEVEEDLESGRLVKFSRQSVPEAQDYILVADTEEHQTLRAKLFEQRIRAAVNRGLQAQVRR